MSNSRRIAHACALAMLALACAPPGIASDGGTSTSTSSTESESTSAGESTGDSETTGPAVIDCELATRVIDADVTRIETAAQMAALADVVEIRGKLYIIDTSMTELVGGNCIERIHDDLVIQNNAALERIDNAFERLRFIGTGEPPFASLWILDNPALVSVTSFHALERIDSRSGIYHNDELAELRFDALTYVGEDLTISGPLLPDLQGFAALTEVAGTLSINGDSIVDLDGLQNLAVVGSSGYGGLSIHNSDALLSLDGITLTQMPRLWIHGNPMLVDLGGLESIVSIDRNLEISDNAALVSLHGLDNLAHVHGHDLREGVSIIANPSLTSLAGLEGLTAVDEHLHVCDNPALTDLGALASLDTLGRLTVIYNDTLSAGEADMIAAALPGIEWVKNDANGMLDGFWWIKDTCPWVGDFICDESAEFQGDVGVECQVDCCDISGPTHLCVSATDDDCQDEPIGPP
jgi:hypothetical protein